MVVTGMGLGRLILENRAIMELTGVAGNSPMEALREVSLKEVYKE
jgi:hypothetical protein